ncbi:hypothetical protein ACSBR2_006230 [Camellia fascicularis]
MLSKASSSHFYSFFFFWFIMLMFIILQPVTSARKLASNAPSKIGVKRSPLPMAHSVTAGSGKSFVTPVTAGSRCSTYNSCRRRPTPSPKKAPCSIYNRCHRGPPPSP